jgi:signal transduction histidine kinase
MDDQTKQWISEQNDIVKMYIHDFKNPVAALFSNLSYLEAVIEDSDALEAVTDSLTAVKSMLRMFDNMLQISRLEAGETVEKKPIKLEAIIQQSIDNVQSNFVMMHPSLQLETSIPDALCNWPEQYAKLAIENLFLSAIHNTPQTEKVLISVSINNNSAIIKTTDSGILIAEEFLDKTFNRTFISISKTEPRARYGKAMGLYAAGLAAGYLGGSITALKPENNFQTIELILPLN